MFKDLYTDSFKKSVQAWGEAHFLRDFSHKLFSCDAEMNFFPMLGIKINNESASQKYMSRTHHEEYREIEKYTSWMRFHGEESTEDNGLKNKHDSSIEICKKHWDEISANDKLNWCQLVHRTEIEGNELFKSFEWVIVNCLSSNWLDEDKTYSQDFTYSFIRFNGKDDKTYFSGKSFNGCTFNSCQFSSLTENEVCWSSCKFDNSSFENSHFKNSIISHFSCSDVTFINTCFSESNIMNVSFLYSFFSSLAFKNTSFVHVRFADSLSLPLMLFINPSFEGFSPPQIIFKHSGVITFINPKGKLGINGCTGRINSPIYFAPEFLPSDAPIPDFRNFANEFAQKTNLPVNALTKELLDLLKQNFSKAFESK